MTQKQPICKDYLKPPKLTNFQNYVWKISQEIDLNAIKVYVSQILNKSRPIRKEF